MIRSAEIVPNCPASNRLIQISSVARYNPGLRVAARKVRIGGRGKHDGNATIANAKRFENARSQNLAGM